VDFGFGDVAPSADELAVPDKIFVLGRKPWPLTCADQGIECGLVGDGCGDAVDCGTCLPPQVCGGGGPSKCG
jgi:hypothetical protein